MSLNNKQHGAVSLFIVVITALLITVITVSFVGIMVKNQQQASVIDLSQSAYDSAQAGVEDAKRALLKYQSICAGGGDCVTAGEQINALTCNTAVESLVDVAEAKDGDEIKVQTGDENSLDQAYTCVKISLKTDDYVGVLTKDDSKIIPLVGEYAFDTVNVEWFSAKDLQGDLQGSDMTVNVPSLGKESPLLDQASWTSDKSLNRPAILRTQLIEFNSNQKEGFYLSDLTGIKLNDNAASHTLFLYPSNISKDKEILFSSDERLKPKELTQVNCTTGLIDNNYSCSAVIKLPKVITADNRTAYLNLSAIYKNTHYRITLQKGTIPVKFNSVQPMIDSTGRTNDLFRRVEARVELNDVNFPYPTAAIYTSGNFCKDFVVTDNPIDYDGEKPDKCQP